MRRKFFIALTAIVALFFVFVAFFPIDAKVIHGKEPSRALCGVDTSGVEDFSGEGIANLTFENAEDKNDIYRVDLYIENDKDRRAIKKLAKSILEREDIGVRDYEVFFSSSIVIGDEKSEGETAQFVKIEFLTRDLTEAARKKPWPIPLASDAYPVLITLSEGPRRIQRQAMVRDDDPAFSLIRDYVFEMVGDPFVERYLQ